MGGRDWYSWGGTRKSSTKKGGGVGRTCTNATSISGGMGGGDGGGGREEKETCSSSSSTTYFPYSSSSTTFSPSTATPVAGCMSAVFNLFDFQFCLHQQQHNGFHQPSYFPHEPTSSSSMKGVEAPRNSLETEEMVNGTDNSLSSIREELEEREENFNIPMGIQNNNNNNNNNSNGRRDTSLLRIHTRSSKSKGDDTLSASGSSTSCSPGISGGARTPSLVARLMGLDLLPEGSTPTGTHSAALCNNVTPRSSSSSSSLSNLRRHLHRKKSSSPPPQKIQQMSRTPGPTGSNKRKNKLCSVSSAGSQSLPETPRTSLARKSDVADYRRLGIQINKENNIHEEFEMSRRSCSAINTNSNVLKRTEKWRFQAFESETKSPRHYARQILKQVKESVSRRRAGVDITNTIHGQSNGDHRTRDENLTMSNNKSRKEDALTRSTVIANNSHSSAGKLNNSPSSDPFSPSQRLRFPESKTTKPAATAAPTTTANDRGENHQQPCPPSPSSTISSLNNHDVEAQPTQPIESILYPMPSHSHSLSQPPPQPLPSSQSPLSQTDQEQQGNLKPKLTQNPRKINAIEVDHYHHPRFYSYSRVKKPHAAHQQAPHIDSIRNKKEEQFVHPSSIANRAANYINPDKKCRKTALSSDLLHVSVPSLVPVVKKDSSPLPSPTKLFVQRRKSEENPSTIIKAAAAQPSMPTTTAQLFSYNNLVPYENKESTLMPPIFPRKKRITEKDAAFADAVAAATASTASSSCGAEYQYISRILKRTGIDKYTPLVSFGQWHSPSHPLDPSIFDALEHTTSYDNENSCYTPITTLDSYSYKNATAPSSPSLGLRCNRKLIFHLVDEILSDILKPHLNSRPWLVSQLCSSNTTRDQNRRMYGFQLVNTLCTKITSFPSAQCQVLQDIDDLIAKDLPSDFGVQNFSGAYEEEGEGIVTEIERDIVDSLVHELRHGC